MNEITSPSNSPSRNPEQWCKRCDYEVEISLSKFICGLTCETPSFENECPNFKLDPIKDKKLKSSWKKISKFMWYFFFAILLFGPIIVGPIVAFLYYPSEGVNATLIGYGISFVFFIIYACYLSLCETVTRGMGKDKLKKILPKNFDENNEYDLLVLDYIGYVKARGKGHSITRINCEIENLLPKNIRVKIKTGTYFIAGGNYQNMATREEYVLSLKPRSKKTISINAVCINAGKPIPREQDYFCGVDRVPYNLIRFLEATRNEGAMVVQAGVWAITDKYSNAQLKQRIIITDQYGNRQQGIMDKDVKEAKRILKDLNIRSNLY